MNCFCDLREFCFSRQSSQLRRPLGRLFPRMKGVSSRLLSSKEDGSASKRLEKEQRIEQLLELLSHTEDQSQLSWFTTNLAHYDNDEDDDLLVTEDSKDTYGSNDVPLVRRLSLRGICPWTITEPSPPRRRLLMDVNEPATSEDSTTKASPMRRQSKTREAEETVLLQEIIKELGDAMERASSIQTENGERIN